MLYIDKDGQFHTEVNEQLIPLPMNMIANWKSELVTPCERVFVSSAQPFEVEVEEGGAVTVVSGAKGDIYYRTEDGKQGVIKAKDRAARLREIK